LAGKLSRIVAILKSAPRQIIGSYKKGRDEAPPVPPPEILRKRQDPPAGPKPPGKDSRTK
jgi:hypothetical protein